MKKVMTILLCVLALASLANANLTTYTVSFDDAYEGSFNINKTLSVPQFDSSLGTLLSVSIDYGISAYGTIGFENTNPTNPLDDTIYTYYYWENPVTHSTKGDLKLDFGSTTIASVNWDVMEGYDISLSAFDGGYDFAGTSGWKTTYLNKSDSGSLFYNSNLDSFIGDSSIDVTFALIGTAKSAMSMPSGMSQVRTTGAGNVTITYEYVPEPATIAILGLGIMGLIRRK
jgi:hypothetical protein